MSPRRTVATHALSIFGDHSDIMACRSTGWAFLAADSVQEAQDMSLLAYAATLEARVPFLHYFDGFRTSHEVNKIEELTSDDVKAMIDLKLVEGASQPRLESGQAEAAGHGPEPGRLFQAREACNPFYDRVPQIVEGVMDKFAAAHRPAIPPVRLR